jgi:hypothetical protein
LGPAGGLEGWQGEGVSQPACLLRRARPSTRPSRPRPRQAGSKVVCVEDGLPTWVCELMVVKPTVEEAITFIKDIEAGMDIIIDPLPPKSK